MLNPLTKSYVPVIDYFCKLHPEFILVGGTALALQEHHRMSIDFDLFMHGDFDAENLKQEFIQIHRDLAGDFVGTPELRLTGFSDGQVHFLVQHELSVTLFKYYYPLRSTKKHGHIKLASLDMILAMKLYAMLQRVEYKDFYDIAVLLKKYSLKQGLKFLDRMTQPHVIDSKIVIHHLNQIDDLVDGAEQSIREAKYSRKQITTIVKQEIKKMLHF